MEDRVLEVGGERGTELSFLYVTHGQFTGEFDVEK